jgi:hypothetical protein
MLPPMKKLLALVIALVACLIFAGTLACSPSKGEDPKHGGVAAAPGVPREAVLAFAGVHTAWGILDELERDRLKAINDAGDPAKAKAALDSARSRNAQLHRLRDALELARKWLAGEVPDEDGRAALRGAAQMLQLLVDEMKGQGLKIPEQVDAGLAAARVLL